MENTASSSGCADSAGGCHRNWRATLPVAAAALGISPDPRPCRWVAAAPMPINASYRLSSSTNGWMCWLTLREIAELKNPPQRAWTLHPSHWGRYSFFQSEMDLRAYGQIDSGIVQSWWLYTDTFIPRSARNNVAVSSSPRYSQGSIHKDSRLPTAYPIISRPMKVTCDANVRLR